MSRVLFYFHIVWATKRRQLWLDAEKAEAVYRCVLLLVEGMGYEALAINGMPDHVHLLLRSGPKIDLPVLMKRVKGATSALVNDLSDQTGAFRWQEGYYAVSVTPSHVPRVLEYVRRQKEHHQEGRVFAAWEETGEDVSTSSGESE